VEKARVKERQIDRIRKRQNPNLRPGMAEKRVEELTMVGGAQRQDRLREAALRVSGRRGVEWGGVGGPETRRACARIQEEIFGARWGMKSRRRQPERTERGKGRGVKR
jgi:hypothetical protein